MEILLSILGIVVGLLLIATSYYVIMRIYFLARRKLAHSSGGVELATVAIVMIISIAIKLILLVDVQAIDFSKGIVAVLTALYSGFAGIQFQNSIEMDIISPLHIAYIATTMLSGMVALTVITSSIRYEWYSALQLRTITGRNSRVKNNRDLYIFTAVTEDTMILAHSIKQQYVDRADKHRCLIIFAGEDIGTFDRQNPLHMDIISNGYLYLSYLQSHDEGKMQSILRKLRLYNNTDYSPYKAQLAVNRMVANGQLMADQLDDNINNNNLRQYNSCRKVHIIAMGLDNKLTGKEATNGNTILEQVECMCREMIDARSECGLNTDKLVVTYLYVLTGKEINYQYYDSRISDVIASTVTKCLGKKFDDKQRSTIAKQLELHFQLRVINEAILAARCLSANRTAHFDSLSQENLFVLDNAPNKDNSYRTMVVGFGMTGQYAMNTLYTDTSYVNNKGVPSQFVADVYDPCAENIAGLYAFSKPMQCCVMSEGNNVVTFDKEKLTQLQTDIVHQYYQGKSANYVKEVISDMAFPLIVFHPETAFSMSFVHHLKQKVSAKQSNLFKYNAYIIAIGDDEANIAMANALLDNIKHQLKHNNCEEHIYPQCLYVNIRDEKNYQRLSWDSEEQQAFDIKQHSNNKDYSLKVIPFGNRIEMYSYERIFDEKLEIRYNTGYNVVYSEGANYLNTVVGDIKQYSYTDIFYTLYSKYKTIDDNILEWLRVNSSGKEANLAANRFSRYLISFFDKDNVEQSIRRIARLEHHRWSRYLISQGWVCCDYDAKDRAVKQAKRKRKEHNNLVPFSQLDANDIAKDIINAVTAVNKHNIT